MESFSIAFVEFEVEDFGGLFGVLFGIGLFVVFKKKIKDFEFVVEMEIVVKIVFEIKFCEFAFEYEAFKAKNAFLSTFGFFFGF